MPKAAYFAVRKGRIPGIYSTWAECEAEVKGFSGAQYKKFTSQVQAQAFLAAGSGPAESPHRPAPAATATTGTIARDVISMGMDTAHALNHAKIEDLPEYLRPIAEQGFSFSQFNKLIVYTDGSGLSNGQTGAKAGLGVFWGDRGRAYECNLHERVPGASQQTNNRGELLSVIRALEECPYPELPLEVRTDSQYTISCMTIFLPKWLRTGFKLASSSSRTAANSEMGKTIKNVDLVKHLLVLLNRRSPQAGVYFKHVKAHVGWEGNEAADRLAKMGASLPLPPDRTDWLDPDTEPVPTMKRTASVDVVAEIDQDWLMSPEELAALEADFKDEDF